jgi:Spy/CpxP family protein refolding chaperone
MKIQLKLLLTLLALGLAGTVASQAAAADKAGRPAKRLQAAAVQRMKQLDENLQLSDAQKQQIKDIWVKQAGELKALSREERKGKAREALMATRTQVRGVLTPEQQAKFDTLRPEGRPGKALKRKKAE